MILGIYYFLLCTVTKTININMCRYSLIYPMCPNHNTIVILAVNEYTFSVIVGFTQFVYIYSTHNKQDHLISRTLACLWICIILCKLNSTNVWLYKACQSVKPVYSITNAMTYTMYMIK